MIDDHKHHKRIHSSLFRRIGRWIPKNRKEYEKKKIPFFLFTITILIASAIIFKVTYTAYQYVVNFEVNDFLTLFSAELEEDDEGRTNILLIGTGGGDHDGAYLTDTIIIASLNQTSQAISLLSIPRDLWLDLPGYGSSRVNKIYDTLKEKNGSEQALNILKTGIENITNLEIPYYVKIDFEGFKKVIDTFGGIEVIVEKSIYDTEYPDENETGYETFSIEAGLQTLNGETALKYARSRHSTSDFDRAKRQQQILEAIKAKAEETNLLSSPLLVKKLYDEFSEHLETNMKIMEMITLARFAKDFNRENLASSVLKDIEIIDEGSFLYTPERALYGGAFVLIPEENSYERIQKFINLLFDYPKFFQEKATIQILNGTKRNNLASRLGNKLIPFGFNIMWYDNADRNDYENTHYYLHRPENTMITEEVIKNFFPKAIKIKGPAPEGMDTSYDITIVLGEDLELEEY